jgi:hypothetical protein
MTTEHADDARFWSKVNKLPGDDACWEWTAALFKKSGYGCFSFQERLQGAHRVSWSLTNGPIPDGLWVLHKCDNRKCVRPSHLFLGTQTDNMRDMVSKGRGVPPAGDAHWMRQIKEVQSGAANFNAKLNEASVVEIKRALVVGVGAAALGRQYGVHSATITMISNGTNWSRVPWPDGASFPVDGEQGARSRGQTRRWASGTGGRCVEEGCGQATSGGRTRCDACWTKWRRESKRVHASAVREQQRAARAA